MTSEDNTKKSDPKPLVTPEKAIKIGEALAALPPKPKTHMTAYDVVSANRAAIIAALQNGYSFIDIAKILVDKDVKISTSTLAHYMRAQDPKSKPSRITKPKAAKLAPPAVPVSPATQPSVVTRDPDTPSY